MKGHFVREENPDAPPLRRYTGSCPACGGKKNSYQPLCSPCGEYDDHHYISPNGACMMKPRWIPIIDRGVAHWKFPDTLKKKETPCTNPPAPPAPPSARTAACAA